jgi:hypothetical protein
MVRHRACGDVVAHMTVTTQASQLWCVQEYGVRGWARISPVFATQPEAELFMPKYAKSVGRKAIRVAPYDRKKEGK